MIASDDPITASPKLSVLSSRRPTRRDPPPPGTTLRDRLLAEKAASAPPEAVAAKPPDYAGLTEWFTIRTALMDPAVPLPEGKELDAVLARGRISDAQYKDMLFRRFLRESVEGSPELTNTAWFPDTGDANPVLQPITSMAEYIKHRDLRNARRRYLNAIFTRAGEGGAA